MKRRATMLCTLLCLVVLSVPQAHAQILPTAKPEQVGLSSERLARLDARLKADVAKGVIPGAIVLVARHGKIAWLDVIGMQDPQTKAPMTKDAIFRVYSMTKPITSVAAMMLFEEGRFTLDEPVAKYLPQFKEMKVGVEKPGADGKPALELTPARRPMTIQDLM